MNPRLSDDAVADLPLSQARAELLEEIMATPTLDRLDPNSPPVRAPRRWTTTMVAAAAVIAVAGVPAYVLTRDQPQTASPAAPSEQTGRYAVLDAPGWDVEHVLDGSEGEIRFVKDGQSLDIHWRSAGSYESYLEDRERIRAPKVDPGAEVELLGRPARMWPYSATEHTVIGPVVGSHFFEVRGSGMDEQAYLALLGRLRQVDAAGFAAAMPEEIVTPQRRAGVVEAMLADVPVPAGWTAVGVEIPRFADRYQTGAPLTLAVTCAWIEVYSVGQDDGDQAAVDRATEAMVGSKSWDVLTEMQKTGDWSPMIWDVGDGMAEGVPGDQIVDWVDCDGDGMSGQNL